MERLARALPLFVLLVVGIVCYRNGLTGCQSGMNGCRNPFASDVAGSGSTSPASVAAVTAELRAIQSAQSVYLSRHEHYACTMAELGSQFGLIDRQLAYGHKDGYNFSIECSVNDNPTYQVWATPVDTSLMAPSSFCVDQTGQLRHASHRLESCKEANPVE
jgi:hypothetical protein